MKATYYHVYKKRPFNLGRLVGYIHVRVIKSESIGSKSWLMEEKTKNINVSFKNNDWLLLYLNSFKNNDWLLLNSTVTYILVVYIIILYITIIYKGFYRLEMTLLSS